jgi:tripartite-type tricarboxylate transporter receptor subunit TctC
LDIISKNSLDNTNDFAKSDGRRFRSVEVAGSRKSAERKGRKMIQTKKVMVVAICCILILAVSSSAQERYPTRPIQIIVPMAPGGSTDLLCRILAEKFREYLGQPVLVVNKPGAGTGIATAYVATSSPDGYNLLASPGGNLGFQRLVNPSFTYGPNDLCPVAGFAKYPGTFVVNKELPVRSLAELVTYAKKNPAALSYASTGYGGGAHLAFESFKLTAGISPENITHIPYDGVAPAIAALMGNQVQIGMLAYSAVVEKQLEAGAIRALAFISPTRVSFRPEIRTVVEEGFPELAVLVNYFNFWVATKTPPPIVRKLEEAARRAIDDKKVQGKMEKMYLEPEFLNSQNLQIYVEDQGIKLGAVIKKLNISIK